MLPPEQDVTDRLPVWDALQSLFMDTDVTLAYPGIVRVCSESKFSLPELDEILYNEVLPALRFNLFMLPAPEWSGFQADWLRERILEKHRYGKRRPVVGRLAVAGHWKKLRAEIDAARRSRPA